MGWSKPTPYLSTVQIIKKQKFKFKIMATKKTYSVDASFVKEAHKAACDTWKKKIETKFPEVFKSQAFGFGDQFTINTGWNGPLLIGHGLAPSGLEGKCLVVSNEYKMEVKTEDGYQILVFKKK